MVEELNLPQYSIKKKKENGVVYIFDDIRKKYLVQTPEEWVRQNFIHYLIKEKNYPPGLISVEKGLKLNQLYKRADVLIYNNLGEPYLLIECKAASVKITQDTFDQVARYNQVFKVPYLIVTNGIDHYCCKIDFKNNNFRFLEEIPDYLTL